MIILGIETSCDETAAAVIGDGPRILSEELATQSEIHSRYGGVVPELACRSHVECIDRIVGRALDAAGLSPSELDAVAVTEGPGLAGALLVGVSFAKTFAYAIGKPVVGINHLEGHITAPVLSGCDLPSPAVALIVSGGHTHLYRVDSPGRYQLIGRTIDDAAGEAFDKAASCLGLGFPGGPHIDRVARTGDPERFKFPRPMLGRSSPSFDMSFSGLKTAFLLALREAGPGDRAYPDLAAGFQDAVVDVLVEKTLAAARAHGIADVIVGGGVAANSRLRAVMAHRAGEEGVRLMMPPPRLCTDNAAMIGAAALLRASTINGGSGLALTANPSLSLG